MGEDGHQYDGGVGDGGLETQFLGYDVLQVGRSIPDLSFFLHGGNFWSNFSPHKSA